MTPSRLANSTSTITFWDRKCFVWLQTFSTFVLLQKVVDFFYRIFPQSLSRKIKWTLCSTWISVFLFHVRSLRCMFLSWTVSKCVTVRICSNWHRSVLWVDWSVSPDQPTLVSVQTKRFGVIPYVNSSISGQIRCWCWTPYEPPLSLSAHHIGVLYWPAWYPL